MSVEDMMDDLLMESRKKVIKIKPRISNVSLNMENIYQTINNVKEDCMNIPLAYVEGVNIRGYELTAKPKNLFSRFIGEFFLEEDMAEKVWLNIDESKPEIIESIEQFVKNSETRINQFYIGQKNIDDFIKNLYLSMESISDVKKQYLTHSKKCTELSERCESEAKENFISKAELYKINFCQYHAQNEKKRTEVRDLREKNNTLSIYVTHLENLKSEAEDELNFLKVTSTNLISLSKKMLEMAEVSDKIYQKRCLDKEVIEPLVDYTAL